MVFLFPSNVPLNCPIGINPVPVVISVIKLFPSVSSLFKFPKSVLVLSSYEYFDLKFRFLVKIIFLLSKLFPLVISIVFPFSNFIPFPLLMLENTTKSSIQLIS